MKVLGYSKFSVLGWSDGGITSLLLAAMYPESIRKMIILGANAYIHPDEIKTYEGMIHYVSFLTDVTDGVTFRGCLAIRDINKWSERMRTSMIQTYGEDYFRQTWSNWIDAMLRLYNAQNGDLCKQFLPKIKCPTFIIHGAKDVMILSEHPMYLKQNIINSRYFCRFETK